MMTENSKQRTFYKEVFILGNEPPKVKDSRNSSAPVENHRTAAWIASSEKIKANSQVIIPKKRDVKNAKEWVDFNEL